MRSPPPPLSAELVTVGRPEVATVWEDVRLQRLWLGLEERNKWRSLSVLAASKSIETIHIAELLAQLAWRYHGQTSGVCDLRDLTMRLVAYQVEDIRARVEDGTRLVVALRSIFENPTAAPIAKQTDVVLLCIALGETTFKATNETLAAVGRDRVAGTIVLRPKARKGRSPASGG